MIWPVWIVLYASAVAFLYLATSRPAPVAAVISFLFWGYLAVLGGNIHILSNGSEFIYTYSSLAYIAGILCIVSVVAMILGFKEAAEEAGDDVDTVDPEAFGDL